MNPKILGPKDVQPLATGELQATLPHDVAVPEPQQGPAGAEQAAHARAGHEQGEEELAGNLLKVKRWAEEVGGP